MGEPITVKVHEGTNPSVRTFTADRSITAMAIEEYQSIEDTAKGRPPDVLAKRLLESGADYVTIYSNVVTVTSQSWDTLAEKAKYLVEHLFEYYGDDAGWADEALAKDGVVINRAEPAK